MPAGPENGSPAEREAPGLDVPALVARARAAGLDGRAPVGDIADWDIFPFEREGLRLRPLADPVDPEPPRKDEAPATCRGAPAPTTAMCGPTAPGA